MTHPVEQVERGLGWIRLDRLSVLKVQGEDSRSWLNGQITNDVRQTEPGRAVHALAVNLKGRIVSNMWVVPDRDGDEESFFLITNRQSVDGLIQQMEGQIIMEDVEVTEVGGASLILWWGEQAQVDSVPVPDGAGAMRVTVTSLGRPSVLWLFAQGDVTDVQAQVHGVARGVGASALSEDEWDLLRHRAREPRFLRDYGTGHLPQEAGLKEVAVSFEKGCYLGQEVVCMLENRGKVARRVVAYTAPDALPVGDLYNGERTVGRVTSCVYDPIDGLWRGFATVKSAFSEPGQVLPGGKGEVVR